MWIRSQDKTVLIDTKYITINKNFNLDKPRLIQSGKFTLGTYSTKEKAMKVMDSLQTHCIQTCKPEFANMIFQMPQDSEVK